MRRSSRVKLKYSVKRRRILRIARLGQLVVENGAVTHCGEQQAVPVLGRSPRHLDKRTSLIGFRDVAEIARWIETLRDQLPARAIDVEVGCDIDDVDLDVRLMHE